MCPRRPNSTPCSVRRPAYLARVDVHSALASTALREQAPGLDTAAGYDGPGALSADAHHRVRAAARALLSAAQRAEARTAALDAFAAAGVVAVHECAGPDIGGLDDWRELRTTPHGVEVTGYWGEAVTTAAEAQSLIETTGASGLAGDLFVDGALGSHTAWLSRPYDDAPDCCGNRYLDGDAIAAHLAACTQARVPAGFHVIGDAAVAAVVDALERVVDRYGVPAVARCGHRLEHVEMVDAEQAAKLGAWGVIASVQPGFDALWGGRSGMYAQRLGADRAARLNPLALLASQGVPLAFGSDSPVTGIDPWAGVRAAVNHQTPGQRRLGARGLLGGHPRRLAGCRGSRRHHRHARCRRRGFLRGVGRRASRGRRAGGHRAAVVHRSALPGARTAATASRRPVAPVPADGASRCGPVRRSPWVGGCWPGLPSLAAVVAAGLLMCASFAPLAWWWSAMLSFAVLAVVLTRPSTTYWGGFGYGFVFGLAFYVPLLPWISGFVGLVPWLALSVMCALFPALFGLLAVAVRSLPGWPLWFAFVWVAQEWLKCSVPFGGFPWGVVGFSQTTGPLLPLAQLGGVPLLSLGVALVGFGLAAIALERSPGGARRSSTRYRIASLLSGSFLTASSTRRHRASGGCAARRPHRRRAADHDAGSPARPPVGRGRRQRADRHRGGGAGQRSASGAGVQRPAARRAGQPRQRDDQACRRGARGPGGATSVRHLAGELLRHRPTGQRGRP